MGAIGAFLKFVSWVASKGTKYVKLAWKYKSKIIEWLNIGQTFEWVYEKLKSLAKKLGL